MSPQQLPIKRDPHSGQWEIHGLQRIDPSFPYASMGPYETRKEAEEDRRGAIRFAQLCRAEGMEA